jgi:hypothetical protein
MDLTKIGDVRRLGEPIKKYAWEIVISDPPIGLALAFVPIMSLRARGTSIPGVEVETITTSFGPFQYEIPGRKKYSRRLAIRFEEGYNWPILPAFMAWMDAVQNETQGEGQRAGTLRSNIWLRLLGPKAGDDVQFTQAIHAYNCTPINIADSPLDYAASDLVHYDVTFSYDYWRWEAWPF